MAVIVKNAVRCRVCGAAADRHENRFECQANPNHVGDLNVGIFSDLTHPEREDTGDAQWAVTKPSSIPKWA